MALIVDATAPTSVITTGNTLTALNSCASPEGLAYLVTSKVIGRRASDLAAYGGSKTALFAKDSLGVISLVGTVNSVLETVDSALALLGLGGPFHTIETDGSSIIVKVKGLNGSTINWDGYMEVLAMDYP